MLFSPKEKGQGLVEWAILLVLVALVVVAALMIGGEGLQKVFTSISQQLQALGQ